MKHINRVMFAGTKSGSGKTTITCGILKCLVDRGYSMSCFKCGPDYIDSMFHSKVIGANTGNLDSFFTDPKLLKHLLCKNSEYTDISIIEGVMGYYDGIGFTDVASSFSVAEITNTPVILVIDCNGMSSSIGALLKGFVEYKKDSKIKGVIFNQLPEVLYEGIKQLTGNMGIISLGYVPTIKECVIESRYLGLVTADEIDNIKQKIQILADKLRETIDIDKIIELAEQTEDIDDENPILNFESDKNINIAVSQDNAFCFLYKDNMDILKRMGCTIIPFSPLEDDEIPKNVDGLILVGGYPELYSDKLSHNTTMLKSIKNAIEHGIPTIAECGGFMYLHEQMEDAKGKVYDMVGVIKGKCFKTNKLKRFGYINMEASNNTLIANAHDSIKAHEFHYWDSETCGNSFHAVKPNNSKNWECVNATDTMYAGFPHLYFYSNPLVAELFVRKCISYGDLKQ